VSYLSSLNIPPLNEETSPYSSSSTVSTKYQLNIPKVQGVLQPEPSVQYFGAAPNQPVTARQSEAARVEVLANPQIQPLGNGIGRFALKGGSLDLDGMFLRHTTLFNVAVYYTDENVVLEDVDFVNCDFKFANTPQARALALQILSGSTVTFQPAHV
jgi:hypothetical protein